MTTYGKQKEDVEESSETEGATLKANTVSFLLESMCNWVEEEGEEVEEAWE